MPAPKEGPNRIAVSPWYLSPATLIGYGMSAAGLFVLTPLCPPAWKPYVEAILFILGGMGFHALKAVAVSSGNQAANLGPAPVPPPTTGTLSEESNSLGSR